jgi:hypothetical protein
VVNTSGVFVCEWDEPKPHVAAIFAEQKREAAEYERREAERLKAWTAKQLKIKSGELKRNGTPFASEAARQRAMKQRATIAARLARV